MPKQQEHGREGTQKQTQGQGARQEARSTRGKEGKRDQRTPTQRGKKARGSWGETPKRHDGGPTPGKGGKGGNRKTGTGRHAATRTSRQPWRVVSYSRGPGGEGPGEAGWRRPKHRQGPAGGDGASTKEAESQEQAQEARSMRDKEGRRDRGDPFFFS